uniref:Sodium-dependent lysophosphatidylcholine symporter 1-like n=1 Tax=Gouania willdenowi TaxID=441366 RepID=A0A8C5ELF2_GOUWI
MANKLNLNSNVILWTSHSFCSSLFLPQRPRVTHVGTKLCYAVGGIPYQMTTVSLGISLQIFLLEVLQPFYVSMILFVSRAWDAVTDPLVGYLVTRSKWTPIGKLTPWLVVSTPLGILSYLLLWFVPPGLMSSWICVLWVLIASCLFETLMSCYNVPYVSLNMFMGGDQRERDSATAYRMSVEMAAMLLASVIQGQVVTAYNMEKGKACEDLDQVYETPHSTSSSLTGAFMTSALVTGALFFLCSLVVFLGVKEQQSTENTLKAPELINTCFTFSFHSHLPQMSLGNFALFCSHASGLGAHFQHLLLVLLVSATLAIPVWQFVLLRIGKKATVFIGLSLFIPAVIVVACVPTNLSIFMTMCILMGFSVATIFLLPWSMLPDVVDDFFHKHPSCKNLEPLFFSCYAFFNKLAGGLSAGLSTLTLQFVGYNASACNQGNGVVTALIVMFSPVPVTLLLIGMLLFYSYPINESSTLCIFQIEQTYLHHHFS